MKKAMMFCGRDENGVARPVSVDENGVIKSSNDDAPEYSYILDDQNKKVLRIVDAAPYLLEYGQYNAMSGATVSVGIGATEILSENANRKYASVYNRGDGIVILSANTDGNGIAIPANSRYDMSVMNGNLYRGQMFANAVATSNQTITTFEQGGIGSNGTFSDSTKRTHTDYIAIDVPDGGVALNVKITSNNGVIRNICAYNASKQQTYWKDTSSFPAGDGDYTEVSVIIPNTTVKYIAISFANATNADAAYSVSDMSSTTVSVSTGEPTTVYVAEGE